MANTRFSIIMNYRAARRQAEQIDNIVQEMNSCAAQYSDCIALLRNNWHGENAQRYVYVVVNSTNNVREIKNRLEKISDALKKVAWQTYISEMRALEISQRRTY